MNSYSLKFSNREEAITSSVVKDEILILLSGHKARALRKFSQAIKLMPALKIVEPTLEDEEKAINMYGRYH